MASATKFGVQKLQPNTAAKLIHNAFNIYHEYKTIRSVVCLSSTLVGGALGASLFVAQPDVASYLEPVVSSALPFLGALGTQIFSGFLGFWVGGGVGYNVSKQASRGVSKYQNGHSNTAYTLDDAQIEAIIHANPPYYPQPEDELMDKDTLLKDVQELKAFLKDARDNITLHKSDPRSINAIKKPY